MENAVCRAVTSLTGQQEHNLSRRVIAKIGCGLSEIKWIGWKAVQVPGALGWYLCKWFEYEVLKFSFQF